MYQISANLIHRELRNATFEGGKCQPQLKGRTLDIIHLEILVKPHPDAIVALLARPLPLDVVFALPEEVAARAARFEEVSVDAQVASRTERAAWE